jgi:hypothetical protein
MGRLSKNGSYEGRNGVDCVHLVGTGDGLCELGNKTSGSVKGGEFLE